MFPLFPKTELYYNDIFVCVLWRRLTVKKKNLILSQPGLVKNYFSYIIDVLYLSLSISAIPIFSCITHPPIPSKCVSCAGCRWLPLYTNICANEVSLQFPRLTSDHFPFLSFPRSQSQVSRADDDDTHQAALSKSDVVLTFQIEVLFYVQVIPILKYIPFWKNST